MSNKTVDNTNAPIIIDPRMLNHYYDQNDEICLGDLWLSLVKQKKVFFISFLIIFGAGLAFSFAQPIYYDYTTTIEIGTKADNETLIQPIETVQSEITSAYINQALHSYYGTNSNDIDIIKLHVYNPKGTGLLVMESHGSIEDEKIHLSIQSDILEKIVTKHQSTTDAIKEEMLYKKLKLVNQVEDLEKEELFASKQLKVQNELSISREKLKKLQEEKANLDDSVTRLASLRQLLQSQYQTNVDNLKAAFANQQQGAKGSKDTQLLVILTSELQQYRTHIAALDERVNIQLPEQEEKIKQELADNFRAQENQQVVIQQAEYALAKLYINRDRELSSLKNQISKINHDILALPVTHAVVPPSRSFKPAKNKKIIIIAISAVLGLFVAVFSALFAGFLAKVEDQNNS